jgi:hypothetical protein
MDQIITHLTGWINQDKEGKGQLSVLDSSALDEFCTALTNPDRSVGLLKGLQLIQRIARETASTGFQPGTGSWSYQLDGNIRTGFSLNLSCAATEAGLYTQLDPQYLFYGLFILRQGNQTEGQICSFNLEQRQDGWYMVKVKDEVQSELRLELPEGADLPWNVLPANDLFKNLLSTVGKMYWLTPRPAPVTGAVAGPPVQAVSAPVEMTQKFCTSCGGALQPGIRFCGQCGARVQAAPPPAPGSQQG